MPVGFIGLGVMGEPMCLNLIERLDDEVVAHDLRPEPVERAVEAGGSAGASVVDVVARCDVVLLSLPGGPELERVVAGPEGILAAVAARDGQPVTVVDHTTAPVALTRDLAARMAAAGGRYLDAPVARTRQAARDGTLSIMVGGAPGAFAAVEPILRLMGSDVTRCGGVGAGQVTKLLNNMMLFQNVRALAEAHAIASGLDEDLDLDIETVFDVIAGASGGSFALSNHGRRSMLPDDYPLEAFSTLYALKDLSYALELAAEAGVDAVGAETVGQLMAAARDAGFEHEYFPVMRRLLG